MPSVSKTPQTTSVCVQPETRLPHVSAKGTEQLHVWSRTSLHFRFTEPRVEMAQQLTPLDAALQFFAPAQESAAAQSKSKPVVALSLPQEPDRKQKRELQKLLVPLMFLLRGRDDIVRGTD